MMAGVGCQEWPRSTGGPILFWAASEDRHVERFTQVELENAVFSRNENAIRLESAVNEAVACQLVFRAEPQRPASLWGVTVDDFQQPDAPPLRAEQIQFYRTDWITLDTYPSWYLRLSDAIRQRREYPDVLIPLSAPKGALPLTLSPESNEIIWMEVRVPPGTVPGVHRSKLHFMTPAGHAGSCDVVLRVHPVALPNTHHLAAVAELSSQALMRHHLEVEGHPYTPTRLSLSDPHFDRAVGLIDQAARLLRAHRCDPVITDVVPARQINARGEVELDWHDYDRILSGMIEGQLFTDRIPAPLWPLPLSRDDPPPSSYGGWNSPRYRAMLGDYLAQCLAHFRARGWEARHYARLPLPDMSRARAYAVCQEWAGSARAADDALRLVCPLTPYALERYGRQHDGYIDLDPWVSIWSPSARLADRDALLKIQGVNTSFWLRPYLPPYSGCLSLLASPQDIRSLAWMAYRFGAGALDLGPVNAWPDPGATSDHEHPPLIWPGSAYGLEGPVPSMRLKRLQRGLQDVEYLWLLEANGRPAVARQMAIDLCPGGGTAAYGEHFLDGVPGGWVRDPAVWQLATQLMTRELVSVMGKDEGLGFSQDDSLRDRLAWSRLMEAVRRVQIQLEGVRVRYDATAPDMPFTIDTTVTLFNATGETVHGWLKYATAPDDWKSSAAGTTIQNLEAGMNLREVVRARAASISPRLFGVTSLLVRLEGEQTSTEQVAGRLALLEPQRLEKVITIDGRLDDWPLAVNNVAGDFLLVGAQDAPKRNRPEPDRPHMKTTAFICRDDTHLYLAFRCEDDQLGQRSIRRSNVVQYDGLWPTGEDLVEVVFDPTGRALSSGDLYHLVLKANGAVIAEKGVPCLEEVAPRADWPVRVEAQIDDRSIDGVWTAEIRLPLSAFPARAAVWGLNVARYHDRLGEYSSWSGAARHIYSPPSLGNMRFAP